MIDEYYTQNNMNDYKSFGATGGMDRGHPGVTSKRKYLIRKDKEKKGFHYENRRNKSRSHIGKMRKEDSRDVSLFLECEIY